MNRIWIGMLLVGAVAGCQSVPSGPEYGRYPYPGKIYPPAEAPVYEAMPGNTGAPAMPGTEQVVPEIGPEEPLANGAATQPSTAAGGTSQPVYPLYPDWVNPNYTPGYGGAVEPQPVPRIPGPAAPPDYVPPYASLWEDDGGWVSPVYPFVPYWDARRRGWDGDHHDHGHGWDHDGSQVYRVPPHVGEHLPTGTPPIAGQPPRSGAIPAAPGAVGGRSMSPAIEQPHGAEHEGVGGHEPAPVPMRPAAEPHSITSSPPVHTGGGGGGGGGGHEGGGGGGGGGGIGDAGGRTHR